MRLLKGLILIAVAIYVALCLAACTLQDQFAFYPDARPATLPQSSLAKRIAIETADGEQLVAFYASAGPGCPTLLNFHGNAQHLDGLAGVTELYAQSGIGFLAVAFRGYSGSTGKPSEKGVREDGQAAYTYLVEQGVSPEQIVLRGFSLGSSIAVGVAANNEAAGLILGAPFESGTRLGAEMLPLLPMRWLAGRAFRSDQLAGDVAEPVLIIHGDSDQIIPADHSLDLAKYFPSSPERVVIAGRDHNDLQDERYERLIVAFLAPSFSDCPSLQELAQ